MTVDSPNTDEAEALRNALSEAVVLLLDFDGPICSVFSTVPASIVAHELRLTLMGRNPGKLPPNVAKTTDPFEILRHAADVSFTEAEYIESRLRHYEVEGLNGSDPNLHTVDAMRIWHNLNRRIAIVSNNSTYAISTYLKDHNIDSLVSYVSARRGADLSLLKPSPYLVTQAAKALNVATSQCVLVGDSPSDAEAASATSTKFIGFANKPHKAAFFDEVDAPTIHDMRELTAAITSIADSCGRNADSNETER